MSEAKHTKGPWTLTHVSGHNFAVQCFAIKGMFGDKPNVYPIFNKRAAEIDDAVIYCSPENARLIVASPELLEALTEMLHHHGNPRREEWMNEEAWKAAVATEQKARAALAKATGAA